jgi:hypothetical protein
MATHSHIDRVLVVLLGDFRELADIGVDLEAVFNGFFAGVNMYDFVI